MHCRRLRDLGKRDRLRLARRAAGYEEHALAVTGGFSRFRSEAEEFVGPAGEAFPVEDYVDPVALLGGRWRRMASISVSRCGCDVVVKDDAMWCIGGCISRPGEEGEEAMHTDGAREVAIFTPSRNSWTIIETPELIPRLFSATA